MADVSDASGLSRPNDLLSHGELEEAGVREFLSFTLADEQYALPLSSVREIRRLPPVTEVPRSGSDILGVISVRGTVTTLIDLRLRMRMDAAPYDERTRVLLVDQGDEVMGLLVDSVQQVVRLREDEVELASVLGSEASSHVMGIGRPGRAFAQRSSAAETLDPVQLEAGREELLILLDPIALLKRRGAR